MGSRRADRAFEVLVLYISGNATYQELAKWRGSPRA